VHAVAKSIIPAALRCLVALIFSLRSLNSAPEQNLPELSYKGKGPWNAGVQHKVIFLSGKYRCKFINLITIRTANLSHTSLLVSWCHPGPLGIDELDACRLERAAET